MKEIERLPSHEFWAAAVAELYRMRRTFAIAFVVLVLVLALFWYLVLS